MNDEPRPQTHDHVITYGVHTITKMEAEGWHCCAAWTTRRPDEHEPYFLWRRAHWRQREIDKNSEAEARSAAFEAARVALFERNLALARRYVAGEGFTALGRSVDPPIRGESVKKALIHLSYRMNRAIREAGLEPVGWTASLQEQLAQHGGVDAWLGEGDEE